MEKFIRSRASRSFHRCLCALDARGCPMSWTATEVSFDFKLTPLAMDGPSATSPSLLVRSLTPRPTHDSPCVEAELTESHVCSVNNRSSQTAYTKKTKRPSPTCLHLLHVVLHPSPSRLPRFLTLPSIGICSDESKHLSKPHTSLYRSSCRHPSGSPGVPRLEAAINRG